MIRSLESVIKLPKLFFMGECELSTFIEMLYSVVCQWNKASRMIWGKKKKKEKLKTPDSMKSSEPGQHINGRISR